MKRISTLVLITLAVLTVGLVYFFDRQMPKEKPGDFYITVSDYADTSIGSFYSSNTIISRSGSIYEGSGNGKEIKKEFEVTEEEMKELYQIFKDNHFSLISTKDMETPDRGGRVITAFWGWSKFSGERVYTKSNAGSSHVRKFSEKQFKNISNALDEFVTKKLNEL